MKKRYKTVLDIETESWEFLMEYGLTQVMRGFCECGPYLDHRKAVLISEIFDLAEKKNEPPIDIFIKFQKRLHARHEHPTTA